MDCLARSHLTGLLTFFSQALLAPKKAPPPSAHSRSNQNKPLGLCGFCPQDINKIKTLLPDIKDILVDNNT